MDFPCCLTYINIKKPRLRRGLLLKIFFRYSFLDGFTRIHELRQISWFSLGQDTFHRISGSEFNDSGTGSSRIGSGFGFGFRDYWKFSSGLVSDCLPFDNTKIKKLSYVLKSIRSTVLFQRSMKKNNRLSISAQPVMQHQRAFQGILATGFSVPAHTEIYSYYNLFVVLRWPPRKNTFILHGRIRRAQ